MKNKYRICVLVIVSFLLIGCPNEGITTYETIKSVRVSLFSFDENGVYPHWEEFNPQELGIGIYPDSIFQTREFATSFHGGNKVYARSNPNDLITLNAIDSLNVYTIYDFDENHPAGSNINDILLYLDGMGETFNLNINELYATRHYLKFSAAPQNDSLQFRVTGRITREGTFSEETELLLLN